MSLIHQVSQIGTDKARMAADVAELIREFIVENPDQFYRLWEKGSAFDTLYRLEVRFVSRDEDVEPE